MPSIPPRKSPSAVSSRRGRRSGSSPLSSPGLTGRSSNHRTLGGAKHRQYRQRGGYCWGGRPPTASVCQNEVVGSQTREPSMGKVIRIGIDTSKSVFVLHGVDDGESPVLRKKLRRR